MNTPLDIYDDMPTSMKRYISNYGWHFNKAAYEYATKFMKDSSGKVDAYNKEQVDNILKVHNITLENNIMYDYIYIATMCKADYLGSSIADERHLALYIKDTIDDVDASDSTTFRRWVATMVGNGKPIDWDAILG